MTIQVATPTGTMLHILDAVSRLTLCGKKPVRYAKRKDRGKRVCNICADSAAKKK